MKIIGNLIIGLSLISVFTIGISYLFIFKSEISIDNIAILLFKIGFCFLFFIIGKYLRKH